MKLKATILSLLLLTSSAFSSGAAAPAFSGDSTLPIAPKPQPLSISSNLGYTLLVPSIGSFKSENYFLSSLQLMFDLAPFYFLSTENLSGERGMAVLLIPLYWALNRVVALPINGTSAAIYNHRLKNNRPKPFLPNFSDKAKFSLTGSMGYVGGDVNVGVAFKQDHFRLSFYLPFTGNGYLPQYFTRTDDLDPSSPIYFYTALIKGRCYGTVDYRYRFHKAMCVNPGILLEYLDIDYQMQQQVFDSNNNYSGLTTIGTQNEVNVLFSPKVSLEITQFNRLSIEHSISVPLNISRKMKEQYKHSDTPMPNFNYVFSVNIHLL